MATGRKTVVVGQTIDPVAWGNPVWDQSVQTFANAADRAAQFPAPLPGAVTWRDDAKVWEGWDGAAWVPVALTKSVTAAFGLDPLWTPAGGYPAPRLSLVAGRWQLTAAWTNAAAGSFSLGYANLGTIPAAARVAALGSMQVVAKSGGFAAGTTTSFVDVNLSTGVCRWYLPAAAAGVGAGAISGAVQLTWDAN